MSSAKRLAREILDTRRLALGHATSPQLTSSALDGGQLDITDGDGNRVGGLGLGDDGGFVIDYTGGPKPPKPSPPTVTADAGIFRIEWDGSFVNEGDEGVLATSDTDRVEIHASMDENFVPDRVESFGGAFATLDGGSFTLGPLPEAGTYYFRLVARSKSAQFSEPSDRVEQELAITSIDLEITDAWLTGEAAQNTADGKNSIWRGPEEPEADPDRPFKDGDIWFEMVDGKSIPNIWDETAGAWVANDDYRQSEIERVQDELRQELDTIVVDGSGTKNFYTPDMPTEGMREGDLWFDSSDKNKPYIYQDGEWITVRDSFVQPGAGQNIFALLDENGSTPNAVDNQWSNVDGYRLVPGPYGIEAEVPAGAPSGTATLRLPLTGTFNSAGEWQITEDDVFESNSLGLGTTGPVNFYSPGAAPTARIVLNVLVPGTGLMELVQDLEVKEDNFGSSQTHSVQLDELNLPALGIYPAVYAWSLFLELNVDSAPGNTVGGSVQIAYAVGGKGVVDGAVTETKISDDAISTPKLQAEAITTEKIAAGAITAESGIIGSINAGTITVGEMDGARIKANTIAADRILVGTGGNLISWDQVARGETYAPHGIYGTSGISLALAPSDAAKARPAHLTVKRTAAGFSYSVYLKGGVDRKIPASPGTEYTFSCSFYSDDAGAQARIILVGYSDFNAANGSGSGYIGQIAQSAIVDLTGDTQRITVKGTTQADAVAVVPWIQVSSGQLIGVIDPVLKSTIGATLIEGGAITTEHIRTGAITAESGIIGSIDANVITVGKIMGNQLDADAINGKTITGAKIRTASSGSRVELTHNGLKQYNSLGATIVDMTSGSFTLQGGSITGSTIKTATSGSRVEINTQGLKQYNSSNEVIAEMVGGSMVMTGVLEAENNVGQFQAGMAFPDGSSTSPGLRWNNIGGTGTWGGIATTNTSRGPGLAMQGPGGTGKYAYVDLSIERAAVRANSTSTRYAYLNMDPAAGEGINLTRSTSANGGSWVTMKDDVSVFTWHGSDANQTTYLNMRANAYDLRAYGASGDLVSGLWADTSATTLSAYKRNLELWGRRVQSMSIYNTTGVASASVYINASTGSLGRNTSSARYKQDIEAAEPLERLLDVETRYWRDRNAVAQYAEAQAYLKEIGEGPLPCSLSETPDEPGFEFGAIAEEVDGLGLSDLVVYDAFGRPDALHYEKFGIALIPIVRSLRDRIEELEAQLESA